jgi:hyperosmotically inducible protein
MNKKLALVAALALATPVLSYAADADADRSQPGTYIKDSAITAKIKTKLAAEHVTSLGRIKVDTDANGIVWLSGSAKTSEAVERAAAIARETDGVRSVENHIVVKTDD